MSSPRPSLNDNRPLWMVEDIAALGNSLEASGTVYIIGRRRRKIGARPFLRLAVLCGRILHASHANKNVYTRIPLLARALRAVDHIENVLVNGPFLLGKDVSSHEAKALEPRLAQLGFCMSFLRKEREAPDDIARAKWERYRFVVDQSLSTEPCIVTGCEDATTEDFLKHLSEWYGKSVKSLPADLSIMKGMVDDFMLFAEWYNAQVNWDEDSESSPVGGNDIRKGYQSDTVNGNHLGPKNSILMGCLQ